MIIELLFAFLLYVSMRFVIGYALVLVAIIMILLSYQKFVDNEKNRNQEIKKLRVQCWKKAINNKLNGYSYERFMRYLVVYHKNRPIKRIIVALVSISLTVLTVYILKDYAVKDVVSMVIASALNVLFNYVGNKVTEEWSEDYYFELLKDDMWLY